MKIKKYIPVIIIALGVILILALMSKQKNPTVEIGNDKIFFYGDTCPHCKNVEDYLATSGTRDKLAFRELEVYRNPANAKLLGEAAQKCGLDTNQGIGVPFFYDGGQCLMGDQDIINYFKQL